MQKLVRTVVSATLILVSQGTNGSQHPNAPQGGPVDTCHTPCTQLKDGKVTIFIHGTVFPGISRLMGHKEKRRGLYHYSANPRRLTGRQRLGRVLHTAAPDEFPVENFYKYYWSGELTLSARKKAAEELYALLKNHKGPCTLIAHSHGCNVSLHLAECAHQKDSVDKDSLVLEPLFTIDRLILLAPPVQEATAHLVHSPVFKRVYSCYSTADLVQVADPQGLHNVSKSFDSKLPLFSKRTYAAGTHLTQAQILMKEKGPSHRDFILPEFFGQLPQIMKLLDGVQATGKDQVMINVPFKGQEPQLIEDNPEYRSFHTYSNKHQTIVDRRKQ